MTPVRLDRGHRHLFGRATARGLSNESTRLNRVAEGTPSLSVSLGMGLVPSTSLPSKHGSGLVSITFKALTGVGSLVLAATGLIATAAPAQAATVSINCSSSGTASATGSTITVNFTGCTDFKWVWGSAGTASMAFVFDPGSYTSAPGPGLGPASLSVFASGATSFTATISGSPRIARFTLTDGSGNSQVVTLSPEPAGGGSSSSAGDSPSPVLQQFGRPAIGTCQAGASKELNWAGVADGGWGETWAEWMNNGKGGAVCSRTLLFSPSQSMWIVD